MKWLLAIFLIFSIADVYAFSVQDQATITPDKLPLPKPKEGAIPWQLFYTTKEKQKKVTYPDGGYSFDIAPEFDDKIKSLNGKEVQIYGFMFPLEQSEKQGNFLIGPYPPSCPFHYHVPTSLIIEVRTIKPIAFSWDEITVEGTLELADSNSNGVFYLLKDAKQVK